MGTPRKLSLGLLLAAAFAFGCGVGQRNQKLDLEAKLNDLVTRKAAKAIVFAELSDQFVMTEWQDMTAFYSATETETKWAFMLPLDNPVEGPYTKTRIPVTLTFHDTIDQLESFEVRQIGPPFAADHYPAGTTSKSPHDK